MKRLRHESEEDSNVDLYEYAAVVMYANNFFLDITTFERRVSNVVPVFTPEDTTLYDDIIHTPNGSKVWSQVRPTVQLAIDERYTPGRRPIYFNTAHYYLLCWTTLRTPPSELTTLLSRFDIVLPSDHESKADAVRGLLAKPVEPTQGGSTNPWRPPPNMAVSEEFVHSLYGDREWEGLFDTALSRASELLDGAFDSLGTALRADTTVYRGISKPSDYKGLWYDRNDDPVADRWVQSLSASVVSTSEKRSTAIKFCTENKDCVLYVFHLPAGMRTIQPSNLLLRSDHGHGEDEHILRRGCTFKLLNQYKQKFGGTRVHVLEVAVH